MERMPDTRQRLIDTACSLLHGRSYAEVGVQAICDRAGVRKGSFYHFFGSKRDLTLAAIEAYRAQIDALFVEALAGDRPPLARLERLVEAAAALQERLRERDGRVPGCPFGNLASEMSTQDEVLRGRLAEVFGAMETHLSGLLEEAVAAGELGGIAVRATAEAMLAYLEGVILLAKTRNDPGVIRRLGPAMARIRVEADARAD